MLHQLLNVCFAVVTGIGGDQGRERAVGTGLLNHGQKHGLLRA